MATSTAYETMSDIYDGLVGPIGPDGLPAPGYVPPFGAGKVGGTGDFVFSLNKQADDVSNVGELRIQATKFIHPNGSTYVINPSDVSLHSNYGEGDSGRYYVMFSTTSTSVRFAGLDNPGSTTQFVNVIPVENSTNWLAFGNSFTATTTFAPDATDCIVAAVEAETTTSGLTRVIATTALSGTTPAYERYYSEYPGLSGDMGTPTAPGSPDVNWIATVSPNYTVPASAYWYSERWTIDGISSSWQLVPTKAKPSGIPFVRGTVYLASGSVPALGSTTWIADVLTAASNQTNSSITNALELGFGTVALIEYTIGAADPVKVSGRYIQGNPNEWVAPGTIIDGALLVDGSVTADTIQGNVIQAGHLQAGSINSGNINVDGDIHIKNPSSTSGYISGITSGSINRFPDGTPNNLLPATSGLFLGIDKDSGAAQPGTETRFFIGNENQYLSWNGSKLEVGGNILTSGNLTSIDGSKVSFRTYELDGRVSGPDQSARANASIGPLTYATVISGNNIIFNMAFSPDTFGRTLVPLVLKDGNQVTSGYKVEWALSGLNTLMYPRPYLNDKMYGGVDTNYFYQEPVYLGDWTLGTDEILFDYNTYGSYNNFDVRLTMLNGQSSNSFELAAFANEKTERIIVDLTSTSGNNASLVKGFDKIESVQCTPLHNGTIISATPEVISGTTLKIRGYSLTAAVNSGRVMVDVAGY